MRCVSHGHSLSRLSIFGMYVTMFCIRALSPTRMRSECLIACDQKFIGTWRRFSSGTLVLVNATCSTKPPSYPLVLVGQSFVVCSIMPWIALVSSVGSGGPTGRIQSGSLQMFFPCSSRAISFPSRDDIISALYHSLSFSSKKFDVLFSAVDRRVG